MWYHTVIKRAKGAFGSPHKLGLWRHHRLEAALAADVREGRSHRPTSDGPTSPLLGTRKKDLALLNRRRPFNHGLGWDAPSEAAAARVWGPQNRGHQLQPGRPPDSGRGSPIAAMGPALQRGLAS